MCGGGKWYCVGAFFGCVCVWWGLRHDPRPGDAVGAALLPPPTTTTTTTTPPSPPPFRTIATTTPPPSPPPPRLGGAVESRVRLEVVPRCAAHTRPACFLALRCRGVVPT